VEWMTLATNRRATADGAKSGTGSSKDRVAFDVEEVYRFIGVLFANGLAPKHRFEYWFETTAKNPLYGNDLVAGVMRKEVAITGRKIWGER